MKKLLLTTLCVSAVALTACDKKPADTSSTGSDTKPATTITANTENKPVTPSTSLSQNNIADIKSDLTAIQTVSTNKSKEALSFQTEISQAAKTGDKNALKGIVEKMKTYVESFNNDLDALTIKSAEVASVRDKMKESNKLGVEMSELGLSGSADSQKVMEIQKKGIALQQSLMTEVQALQAKVNAKP